MFWLIIFLTVLLIIDCLFLILLVLVQLPKKEAGLGQAFGSGTTDALFGAGSGNALTKLTKYFTAGFFILTLSLSILNAQQSKNKRSSLERAMEKAGTSESATLPTAPNTPAAAAPVTATSTVPLTSATNLLSTQPANTTTPANVTTNAPGTAAPVEKK
jgi:preprotein translocase subunit SecG